MKLVLKRELLYWITKFIGDWRERNKFKAVKKCNMIIPDEKV